MTAIEEQAAAGAGKSTQDGSGQLSVGDATRATLPHLPYADAVLAALDAWTLPPDTAETGVRREPGGSTRELFLRLEWLPGHDELTVDAMRADGLAVEWSHLAGWSARTGTDVVAPAVDKLADPAVIAEMVLHAVLCGLGCDCVKTPGGSEARWEHAVYLEIGLLAYDERTNGALG